MKMKYIIIICVVIILLIVLGIVLLPRIKEKKIENMNHLRFTYTTGYHMNASVQYEINLVDGKYIASIKPTDLPEESIQEFELSKDKVKEIEDKLNEYHVGRWNGFNKSNKYVLDGDSFSLNIRLGKDDFIDASGYMMWPNNYREVRDYLDSVLGSLYKKIEE